jgi:excisionase family DNA binding protein
MKVVGIENAVKSPKVQNKGWNTMLNEKEDTILTSQEACDYLRISRPTYLKYLHSGRIKGTKAGKGWRVFKSKLDRFLKGDKGDESLKNVTTEDYTRNLILKGN